MSRWLLVTGVSLGVVFSFGAPRGNACTVAASSTSVSGSYSGPCSDSSSHRDPPSNDHNDAPRIAPEVRAVNDGVAASKAGDWETAIADFYRAMRADDRYVLAHIDYGIAEEHRGYPERALAQYEIALRMGGDKKNGFDIKKLSRWIAKLQGDKYREARDWSNAESAYRNCIRIEPALGDSYSCRWRLAVVRAEEGHPEESVQIYGQLLAYINSDKRLLQQYADDLSDLRDNMRIDQRTIDAAQARQKAFEQARAEQLRAAELARVAQQKAIEKAAEQARVEQQQAAEAARKKREEGAAIQNLATSAQQQLNAVSAGSRLSLSGSASTGSTSAGDQLVSASKITDPKKPWDDHGQYAGSLAVMVADQRQPGGGAEKPVRPEVLALPEYQKTQANIATFTQQYQQLTQKRDAIRQQMTAGQGNKGALQVDMANVENDRSQKLYQIGIEQLKATEIVDHFGVTFTETKPSQASGPKKPVVPPVPPPSQ